MTNKSIAYVIYNTKSEYYYTQFERFGELSFKTKLFPSREVAEQYIQMAIREQIYELLEQIYSKHRLEIDINQDQYDNIKEHVVMEVRPVYMFSGDETYVKD